MPIKTLCIVWKFYRQHYHHHYHQHYYNKNQYKKIYYNPVINMDNRKTFVHQEMSYFAEFFLQIKLDE